MGFLDKTFCASPNCKNECGRQLTEEQKQDLAMLSDAGYWSSQVSYSYFCGEPNDDLFEKMLDLDSAVLDHEIRNNKA